MFAFEINGVRAVLGDKFSLNLEFNHPGFVADLLREDFIFPITLPDDDEGINRKLFGFENDIQIETVNGKFPGQAILNNNFYRNATLFLDRYTHKTFSGALKLGIYQLPTLDKKLCDLYFDDDEPLGADTDAVVAYANSVNTGTFPGRNYCFPSVHSPDFYGDRNPDFAGIINRHDITNDTLLRNTTVNSDCLVAMPYVKYVLKKVAEDAGLQVEGDFWTDTKQDRAYLFNNYALDGGDRPSFIRASLLADLAIYDNDLFRMTDDSTVPNSDVSNLYTIGTGEFECLSTGFHRLNAHVKVDTAAAGPFNINMDVYKNSFSTFLGTFLAGTIQFSGPNEIDIVPIIVYGNAGDKITYQISMLPQSGSPLINWTLRAGTYCTFQNTQEAALTDYSVFLNIRNHVPQTWLVRDFLRELKNTFFLKYEIDESRNVLHVDYCKNLLTATPEYVPREKEIRGHDSQLNTSIVKSYGFEFPSDDGWTNDNTQKQPFLPNFQGEVNDFDDLAPPTAVNRTVRVANENRYYISVDTGSGLEWQFYTDDYAPVTVNTRGTLDLRSKLAPLFMTHINTPMTGNVRMPTIRQTGSSTLYGLGQHPSEPRIAYFWPIAVSPSANYPYSTPLAVEPDMTAIADAVDMRPSQMHINYWMAWLAVLNAQLIRAKFVDYNLYDLFRFNITKLLHMSNLVWLVSKANITIRGDKIDSVRFELMLKP